jgi:hypothetical protein
MTVYQMPAKTYSVTDINDKTYSIGFPVLSRDLAVFLNGIRLEPKKEFDFDQTANSVKIKSNFQVGDLIHIRLIKDK